MIKFISFLTISMLIIFPLTSCSKKVVKTPTSLADKVFPTVRGNSLKGEEIVLPTHYKGQPTMILVGYKQNAQFDIDRWILGLLQADVKVKIVEVPTISGMMPQMVQGFIDDGMRSGIPKEDWGIVVTVYEDADKIINAIGNERPQSAHAVLLDRDSKIIWSSNRGYSATQVLEVKRFVEQIN